MIISLLFLETLASLSKEKLLILIDEPELHLHPKLQERLADYLWNISQGDNGHQIFATTHSPIFFKNCVIRSGVKTFITKKDSQTQKVQIAEITLDKGLFPWSPSWGEINYFAYDYMTVEFHDELYGYIQEKTQNYTEKDVDEFLTKQNISRNKKWTREKDGKALAEFDVTLPVFIRNKVHHPENKTMLSINFTNEELKESIEAMIKAVKSLK